VHSCGAAQLLETELFNRRSGDGRGSEPLLKCLTVEGIAEQQNHPAMPLAHRL
jgi:hypothetical protein